MLFGMAGKMLAHKMSGLISLSLWRHTADGGFFSPVENAYWRGFSRVCVDYNTAMSGKKRVVFPNKRFEYPAICPLEKLSLEI